MVWSYCKKISPEWKHQVSTAPSPGDVRFLVCCFFLLLHCFRICLNRWSRRWSPVRSSRTRRTTTHRACPNCLSAQDSVRHFSHYYKLVVKHLQAMWKILTACLLLFRWRGHQPQGGAGSGQRQDEGQSSKSRRLKSCVCECVFVRRFDPSSFCSQYAVPVTKYDRKGYKARPRQLLLTASSAVIIEEAKLKQRIDYGALKGQRSTAGRHLQKGLFLFRCVQRWVHYLLKLSYPCRHLSQLSQRRLVCSARAQWRQQTEGETQDLS